MSCMIAEACSSSGQALHNNQQTRTAPNTTPGTTHCTTRWQSQANDHTHSSDFSGLLLSQLPAKQNMPGI